MLPLISLFMIGHRRYEHPTLILPRQASMALNSHQVTTHTSCTPNPGNTTGNWERVLSQYSFELRSGKNVTYRTLRHNSALPLDPTTGRPT